MDLSDKELLIILLLLFVIAGIFLYQKQRNIEYFRDPIYLNRAKLAYDWYPRSNGSIYGLPLPRGSHHMLSGFPFYDNVY